MRMVLTASIVLLSFAPRADSQPAHFWSKPFAGNWSQACRSIAVDGDGSLLVASAFNDSLWIDGDTLVTEQSSDIYGNYDILLTKLGSNGAHLWSRQFGDTLDQWAREVACDAAGNIFIAGEFKGVIDFGGGPLASTGSGEDIFVAAFDGDGNHSWSRRFGNGGGESCLGLVTDGAGNVLFCGQGNGTLDFGGGPLVGAPWEVFIVKLGANGDHVWSRGYPGQSSLHFGGLAVDAYENVLAAGWFTGPVDFGGGVLNADGLVDAFLVKWDANGNHLFSKRFGDSQEQYARSINCDVTGGIVISGEFNGTVDFGGGNVTSTHDADAFVTLFDGDGTHVWTRSFGGNGRQAALDVVMDATGSALTAGYFTSEIDFGSGVVTGPNHMFLAKLAGSGANAWQATFGVNVDDLAIGPDNGLLMCGTYSGSVQFGNWLLPAGSPNGFVTKFLQGAITGIRTQAPAAGATLGPNFPNPFNPSTTIEFSLDRETRAIIGIYDPTGRLVARLDRGTIPAGVHAVRWDGRDSGGRAVRSGVYFYRLEGIPAAGARKMVLLK